MRVGFIGLGVVGEAIRRGISDIGHETASFDKKDETTSLSDVLETDLVFISVPTPSDEEGRCDTSIVEEVVFALANEGYKGLAVIKSTVEPGTTDRLQAKHPTLSLAFCPEFLRARHAYADFMERHDVCIIGASKDEHHSLLRDVHGKIPKEFVHLTPLEAEFVKYFKNFYNALRVLYASQFYDVCKKAGVDYQKIKNAAVKNRVIPDIYLDCSGEEMLGFGGACLPKDTKAFAHYAENVLGHDRPSLFSSVVEINKKYKKDA